MAGGLQDKFQWKNVAAAAAGAGVGHVAGEALGQQWGHDGWGGLAARSVAGLAAGATAAAMRGGRVNVQRVATDAFGNALGDSIAALAASPGQAMSAAQANTDQKRQDFRRFEIEEFNRTEGAARREAFLARDPIAAAGGFSLDRVPAVDPRSAKSIRGSDGVYRVEIRGTNATPTVYGDGVGGDRVEVIGRRMTEAEKAAYDAQLFQQENDARVAAGTYDRLSAIGDAFSAGRYGDAWRHSTFEASGQARAASIARSFPQPSPEAQRLNKLLSSPIGATASLAVRGFGGSQRAQDIALDLGALGEGAVGAALGLPRAVGVAQVSLASPPRGLTGDARRAYLDQKFGRTGDLNFDINARGASSIRAEMDRLTLEGHAVGRHGPRVTDLAIDNRARFKWDPITGTTTDYYTRGTHSVGRNSSKFLTDEALLTSERNVRNSPEFDAARIAAEGTGKPQFVVKGLPLEGALGPNYLDSVYGRSRIGPIGGLTVPIDFTDGTLTGVFRQSRSVWNLHTLYPEPRP